MNQFDTTVRLCMEKLGECHRMCLSMAMTHCLEMGGEHARPQHLRLMLDCAAICAFTADALGRKSQFHSRFAALCAEVCETCAEDCAALGEMEACVQACRECAQACREIAKAEGAQRAEIRDMASRLPPN